MGGRSKPSGEKYMNTVNISMSVKRTHKILATRNCPMRLKKCSLLYAGVKAFLQSQITKLQYNDLIGIKLNFLKFIPIRFT